MSKMQIVKTAGKQYRLYNEDGKPVGSFTNLRDAKLRMNKRGEYLKNAKKAKVKTKKSKR